MNTGGLAMTITRFLLLPLLAGSMALTGCDAKDPTVVAPPKVAAVKPPPVALNKIDRSHAGTPAPDLVFEARGGDKTTLADFKGKRVLVNLWATWCAPCVAEMPELDAMAAGRTDWLTVIPLSQDIEGWQAVNKFFTTDRFHTLLPYLDQPGSFAERLGAKGLPMSILYDEQGKEVWRVAGTLRWSSGEVTKQL